jgi:hypothetical protein
MEIKSMDTDNGTSRADNPEDIHRPLFDDK